MTEIRVPTLGESVTEATIGRWFKKLGDPVRADEALAELETDKVTLEVNAPASGVLAEIVAKAGETVAPGALLGQIAEGAAASAPKLAPVALAAVAPASPPMPPSPAAAKIALEKGLDLSRVAGSGKRGQVLKEDALKGDVIGLVAKAQEPRQEPRQEPGSRRRRRPSPWTTRAARSACA